MGSGVRGTAAVIAVAATLWVGCGKGDGTAPRAERSVSTAETTGTAPSDPAEPQLVVESCSLQPIGARAAEGAGRVVLGTAPCGRQGQPPTVVVGAARVGGGMEIAVVRRMVRTRMEEIRTCYRDGLARDATLAGRVEVELTLAANGQVVAAAAEGMHPEVAACVARVVGAIRFPESRSGGIVKAHLPFVFKTCPPEEADGDAGPAARGEAEAAGEAELSEHLQKALDPLRTCYRQAAGQRDATPSEVRIDIAIQSDGRVADARSPDAVLDAASGELYRCIEAAVEAMTFPPSRSGPRKARCTLVVR